MNNNSYLESHYWAELNLLSYPFTTLKLRTKIIKTIKINIYGLFTVPCVLRLCISNLQN